MECFKTEDEFYHIFLKEKEIFDESDTGSLEKQKKSRLKDRCEDLCVAIEKMSKVDLSQKGNHSETVVLYFARENIWTKSLKNMKALHSCASMADI